MNPLLEVQFAVPFDQIKAEHVEPAIDTLLEQAAKALEATTHATDPLTALDAMTEPLDYALNVVRHLESVATTPELRAAYNAVQPKTSAFYSSIPLNDALWQAIKKYATSADGQALTGTRKRFLTKTVDSFKRHGAELDAAGKARLKELDVALAEVTTKFSENVLDATNAWDLIVTDEAQLKGLPPQAIAMAKAAALTKDAEKYKDAWRFTLQAPSYIAVLTYLDDQAIRKQMWQAFAVRAAEGKFDNRELIVKILELRKEKAQLLGFRDFADLVLEDRMAHTGAKAQAFLDDLRAKTEKRFREENAELEAFAGKKPGERLDPWDIGYWSEKQRAALYDFDEEALRPYFPLASVVNGMFQIFGRILGIKVTETKMPVWDKEVKTYDVHDATSGTHLGSFYADWYPRENKRGGAWMDSLITGNVNVGRPNLGLICGNLTPPVDGKPALLTHREAETIFHEFGHLLHHLLTRVEVRSLAGTNVAWDWVELPSQIMENWCWEREALDTFARHYEMGAPLPEDLFQKMKRAKTFRAANMQMRQLGFGFVDLGLHRDWSMRTGDKEDVLAYARQMLQQFSASQLPNDYAMIASFTHL